MTAIRMRYDRDYTKGLFPAVDGPQLTPSLGHFRSRAAWEDAR